MNKLIRRIDNAVCSRLLNMEDRFVDQRICGHLLKNRQGWTRIIREKVVRIHGVRIALCPQGFSIWHFEPENREKADAGNE